MRKVWLALKLWFDYGAHVSLDGAHKGQTGTAALTPANSCLKLERFELKTDQKDDSKDQNKE